MPAEPSQLTRISDRAKEKSVCLWCRKNWQTGLNTIKLMIDQPRVMNHSQGARCYEFN